MKLTKFFLLNLPLRTNDMLQSKTNETHEVISVSQHAELDVQITTAKAYPRNVKNSIDEARNMALINEETAEACFYCLPPRKGSDKNIEGKSIRLAEIMVSAWGNIHAATRILGIEGDYIIAEGVAWDLEKNTKIAKQVKRKIVSKQGYRYSDDMIVMTGNAASSIALRNAIFAIIPSAFSNPIYEEAKKFAVGQGNQLRNKVSVVIDRFSKMGVTKEQVLLIVGKKNVEDVTSEDLQTLIGLGTAIKDGTTTIEEVFANQTDQTELDRIAQEMMDEE